MTVLYDPYSDTAMRDPHPLYARLRAEDPVHYIEKYQAWALTRFDDVWEVSRRQDEWITFTAGQTPGQLLLGEPVPHTFMTMDGRDHRQWRGVVRRDYTAEGAAAQAARIRALVREILAPLLERGSFDAYRDLANRVLCINAGYNLGLPPEDAETWRALIDDLMHRDPGQIGGGSGRNQAAGRQLFDYLNDYAASLRRHPEHALRHTAAYMNAEFDGVRLDDGGLTYYLYSLLVVGSETTPMTIAATLYYLARHPQQKAGVLADPSLIVHAFLEAARYDQPTNMLARRAKTDFDVGGKHISSGDNLLFIYASANRDEAEFERADQFDIHRRPTRNLSFGVGGHKCLGMHLAVVIGRILLEELLGAIDDYDVDADACERAYGEHLSGFIRMPMTVKARGLTSA